jgi:hypothetical protein
MLKDLPYSVAFDFPAYRQAGLLLLCIKAEK